MWPSRPGVPALPSLLLAVGASEWRCRSGSHRAEQSVGQRAAVERWNVPQDLENAIPYLGHGVGWVVGKCLEVSVERRRSQREHVLLAGFHEHGSEDAHAV